MLDKVEHIDDLPPEMFLRIMSYLKFDELLDTLRVSRRWSDMLVNSTLCHRMFFIYSKGSHSKRLKYYETFSSHPDLVRNIAVLGLDSLREIVEYFEIFTSLQTVMFKMCKMEVDVIRMLHKFKNLKTLHVTNCYRIGKCDNEEWNFDFSSFPQLKGLCLTDFGLTNSNFNTLLACENLVYIDIRKIRNISHEHLQTLLVNIKETVKFLFIYGEDLTSSVMESIADCSKLETLCIIRCEPINDEMFLHLKRLRLKKIFLWNNNIITEKALCELFSSSTYRDLTYISFSKITNLTKVVISIIAENCLKLDHLGLYMCMNLKSDLPTELEIRSVFRTRAFELDIILQY